MNTQVLIAFVACLVAAQAGVLVDPSAKILQGPSSKTTVVGNDGSVISAVAPGGQIIHEEHSGVVAHAAPVVARYAPAVAHYAPAVARYAPAVAHYAPAVVRYAPAVAHYAPARSVAHGSEDVIVAGPSGTISTSRLAAPILAEHGPVLTRASPVVAHYAPVVDYAAGHEFEREYLHDHSKALYHDGSYKVYGY